MTSRRRPCVGKSTKDLRRGEIADREEAKDLCIDLGAQNSVEILLRNWDKIHALSQKNSDLPPCVTDDVPSRRRHCHIFERELETADCGGTRLLFHIFLGATKDGLNFPSL